MAKDTITRQIPQCEGPFFRYFFVTAEILRIFQILVMNLCVDAEWGLGKKEGRFRVVGIG